MVQPRTPKIDRRACQVQGVQPASDASPCLEHHALHTGVVERVGDGEPSDASAHHDYAPHRPRDPAGDLVAAAIEAPYRQDRC